MIAKDPTRTVSKSESVKMSNLVADVPDTVAVSSRPIQSASKIDAEVNVEPHQFAVPDETAVENESAVAEEANEPKQFKDWIDSTSDNHFTVQLFATSRSDVAQQFIDTHQLTDVY